MVVDAVMMLDDLLQLKMIGIKKVQGGALEVSSVEPVPKGGTGGSYRCSFGLALAEM